MTWSANCVIVNTNVANQGFKTFEIKNTKIYVLVVTLSTQYNVKLLPHLKSRFFKRTIGTSDCQNHNY